MTRYGDRDAFVPGSEVEAPDGRPFVQGDTSTYTRTELPPQTRPRGYRQDYGPTGRTQDTLIASKIGGKVVAPTAGNYRVVSRVEEELYWLVTYEDPDGDRHTIRHLRSTREGNG